MTTIVDGLVSATQAVSDNAAQYFLMAARLAQRLGGIAATGGTANAIVIAPDPAYTGLADGTGFRIVPLYTNTDPVVTVQVNGLAPIRLYRRTGTDLAVGDVVAGVPIDIVKTAGVFRLAMPGIQEAGYPVLLATAAARTFVAADRAILVRRSNGGAAMTDTLPGATAGAVANGWSCAVKNSDSAGALTINAGAGSQSNGGSSVTIPKKADAYIYSDGTNYWCSYQTTLVSASLGVPTSYSVIATPDGKIVDQWGTVSNIAQGSYAAIALPVSYGVTGYKSNATPLGAVFTGAGVTVTQSAGGAQLNVYNTSTTNNAVNASWDTRGNIAN